MSSFGALGELPIGDAGTQPAALQQSNHAGAGAIGEFALGEQGASETSGGALGLPIETDSAFAIQPLKVYPPLGLASESDSGLAITINRAYALGLASETDSALAASAFLTGKRQLVAAIAR